MEIPASGMTMRLLSLSARRAWIEIGTIAAGLTVKAVALRKESVDRNMGGETLYMDTRMSLSARRAWIEIADPGRLWRRLQRRSPQGERG